MELAQGGYSWGTAVCEMLTTSWSSIQWDRAIITHGEQQVWSRKWGWREVKWDEEGWDTLILEDSDDDSEDDSDADDSADGDNEYKIQM
jgi:hypothetical protein